MAKGKKKDEGRHIGYCRVSTAKQDAEGQRLQILDYANKNGITIGDFIEVEISSRKDARSRRIDELLNLLQPGDSVIVAELSRLGRSVGEIARFVDELVKERKGMVAIKENIRIPANGGKIDMTSKIQISMFSLFAEIERDLISERTKAGLEAVRAQGKRLGRPKGPGKSKLDPQREEIIKLLKLGVPKVKVAKKFGAHVSTFENWLKKNKIDVPAD